VGFAKDHHLGVFALNLPNGPKVPSIVDAGRLEIKSRWLNGNNNEAELKEKPLEEVLKRILEEHDRAFFQRRSRLVEEMQSALVGADSSVDFNVLGTKISVSSSRNRVGTLASNLVRRPTSNTAANTMVQLTPRPPRLKDFHEVDVSRSAADKA
jgi:hypothetical protein